MRYLPHLAVGLASIPEKIRGFGHIKMRNLVAGCVARSIPRQPCATAESGRVIFHQKRAHCVRQLTHRASGHPL